MPPSINSSIHQFIYPSIPPSTNASIHQFIISSIHQFLHPSIHLLINPSTNPYIHQFIHTSFHPFINSSANPSMLQFILPSIPSLISLFIHLPINSSILQSFHQSFHPSIHPSSQLSFGMTCFNYFFSLVSTLKRCFSRSLRSSWELFQMIRKWRLFVNMRQTESRSKFYPMKTNLCFRWVCIKKRIHGCGGFVEIISIHYYFEYYCFCVYYNFCCYQ